MEGVKRGRPPKLHPSPMGDRDHVLDSCAARLEHAAALRAGAMDSDSRHMEIANEMRLAMLEVAGLLRG